MLDQGSHYLFPLQTFRLSMMIGMERRPASADFYGRDCSKCARKASATADRFFPLG